MSNTVGNVFGIILWLVAIAALWVIPNLMFWTLVGLAVIAMLGALWGLLLRAEDRRAFFEAHPSLEAGVGLLALVAFVVLVPWHIRHAIIAGLGMAFGAIPGYVWVLAAVALFLKVAVFSKHPLH